MVKKNILFMSGMGDDQELQIKKIDMRGNIQWILKGSADVGNNITNDFFNSKKIILDTTQDQELPRQMIHGVFNEISDPDTHKIALQKADDFYKAVSGHVPFFNIPSHVLRTTRDNIYRLLQGIDKLYVPKTVRIQPKRPSEIHEVIKKEGFTYPVIFRQAGDHGGISTIRVDDATEEFHAFALDGREYYLTQFIEYAEDSLYKKYRLIIIDGDVHLRHVKISAGWLVHHKSQIKNPEKLQNRISKRFTSEIKPKIQPIISEIYSRIELDFFGIDCYIDNEMNILVFEVNANMSIFQKAKVDIFEKHLEMIRQNMIQMIHQKTNVFGSI